MLQFTLLCLAGLSAGLHLAQLGQHLVAQFLDRVGAFGKYRRIERHGFRFGDARDDRCRVGEGVMADHGIEPVIDPLHLDLARFLGGLPRGQRPGHPILQLLQSGFHVVTHGIDRRHLVTQILCQFQASVADIGFHAGNAPLNFADRLASGFGRRVGFVCVDIGGQLGNQRIADRTIGQWQRRVFRDHDQHLISGRKIVIAGGNAGAGDGGFEGGCVGHGIFLSSK